MTGGSDTCFLAELNVNNDKFLVRVDTGSSDTVLPRPNLNNYVGPTVDIIIPADADIRSSQYGDGSTWTGYMVRLEAGMGVTEGIVPLALMTSQSTNPIFSAGDDGVNGLMGLGYPKQTKTIKEQEAASLKLEEIKAAVEVLLDPFAKAKYDLKIKAEVERKKRDEELDAVDAKLKRDLEEREAAVIRKKQKTASLDDLDRIREEGRRFGVDFTIGRFSI